MSNNGLLALAWLVVVGFGGWPLVRGHGTGWRFAVWLTLLLGPAGLILAVLARRSARIVERADPMDPPPKP